MNPIKKWAEVLNRHLTKKVYNGQISMRKYVQHPMYLGNCKLTMRYPYISIQNGQNSKTLTTPNAGIDVEQQELSQIAGWNAKWYSPFRRQFVCFLKKLNILFLWDLAVTLLDIYPMKLKTYVHTKTCKPMFVTALFIIAKSWKQPRYPSVSEWLNKL